MNHFFQTRSKHYSFKQYTCLKLLQKSIVVVKLHNIVLLRDAYFLRTFSIHCQQSGAFKPNESIYRGREFVLGRSGLMTIRLENC